MPVSRYSTIACSVLLAWLFISSAYQADDVGHLRFDGSLYESALYAPRRAEVEATTEPDLARDVTPAVRVREVFAVFVPNERRRGKRDT
jgi:hypothetical protein